MKNKIVVFATFVFVSLSTFATTNTSTYDRYYNDYGNSFTFVERGVTFSVFQNGEFDFYINSRNDLHVGYQKNGINISFNSGYNYDAYVQYDSFGAIIQIEDIPIYYDYYGRVDRIGNINLNYQHGRLARLGGMHVYYNSYGSYSHFSGYINVYNRNYVYHPYHNYFARPFFEYRVVSYNPYRNHYKPNRYKYYRDHSRNTYYSKNNKRINNNTRQRVATHKVPKRKTDRIANIDRNNTRSYNTDRTNRNIGDNTINSSTRRSTTGTRAIENTRTVTDRTRTGAKRVPEKSIQQKRVASERKPVRTQERRRSTATSKKPVISQNRSKTVDTRKATNPKERRGTERTKNPEKRESDRNENIRKRRS